MRESKIEQHLREQTEKLGGKCLKLVAIGKDRGIPDRLLILPKGINVYVELKAPGKVSSKQQVHRQNELLSMGQHVFVIDTILGVDKLISWLRSTITLIREKGTQDERDI